MKHFIITGLLICAMHFAQATRIEWGKTTIIDKPVYEDLYIAGSEIIINAPVHGDLIVAGGTVTINDTVFNDILVAGGTVNFNGFAGDDIRCAGGKLNILKDVTGDVVAAGGTIVIGKNVVIGSLIGAGGDITIDGTVAGMVKTASGKLQLNGNVMKDLDWRGGQLTINGTIHGQAVLAATDKIIIGNAAAFENGVRYWAPDKKVDFKQAVKGGQVTFDPSLRMDKNQWYYLGFSSVLGVFWYLGMVLVLIMIVQYLFSATMRKAGQTTYDKMMKSLGYGVLFWIGVPIAAVLACVTVIGVPVGLIALFSYIILALLATTITSVVAANWLNSRSRTNWQYWRMVFAALGIFILFKILTFTPFFGWFILAVLISIAFGSILLNINWRRKTVQVSGQQPAPAI